MSKKKLNQQVILNPRRFPAELRNSTSYMEDDWSTNMVFALFQTAGPREPTENNGAAPSREYLFVMLLPSNISTLIFCRLL